MSLMFGAVTGYISTSPQAAAYNVAGLTNGNQEILADPNRPLVYLAHPEGNSLDFINSTTGQVENTITVGTQPTSIDLSSNGAILYVAISGENGIKLVSVTTRSVTRTISLNFAPLSIQAGRSDRLYVSGLRDSLVRVIDESSGKVVNSVDAVRPVILEVSPDGNTLLTAGGMLDPVPVSKYSIATDTPSLLATDWTDLGDNFQQMAVDWTKGIVYVACGGPYGLTIAHLSDLAWAGFLPMEAYTGGVALAKDGQTVFGVNSWYAEGYIWGFNTTSLSLVGKIPAGPDAAGLAVAGDLKSAYITMPGLKRFPLCPSISPLQPGIGLILGYTPNYVSAQLVQGIPRTNLANTSVLLDSTALTTSMPTGDELRGAVSGFLPDGIHSVNASVLWRGERYWANWSFNVSRSSPLAMKPTLEPIEPVPGGVYDTPPVLATAMINMTTPDTTISSGAMWVDDLPIYTSVSTDALNGNISTIGPNSYGNHTITASILWDNGLGSAWVNWTFVIQRPPSISALYPVPNSTLDISPDHIDIAIDPGDPEVLVEVTCWLDNVSIATSLLSITTARAMISGPLTVGWHSVSASYTWEGTTHYISWGFYVAQAQMPLDLTLVRYENPAGFAMPVPQSWSRSENETVSGNTFQLVLRGPIYNSFQTNILVATEEDSSVRETNSYLQDQVDGTIQELADQGNYVNLVEGPNFTRIANHSGVVFAIKWNSLNITQKLAFVVSEELGRYWMLTFSIDTDMYAQYNATFNSMIAGFEITLKTQKISGWTSGLLEELTGITLAAAAGGIAGLLLWISRRRRVTYGSPQTQEIQLAQPLSWSTGAGQFVCPRCMQSNLPGAMFCSRCGIQLPPIQPPGKNPPGN